MLSLVQNAPIMLWSFMYATMLALFQGPIQTWGIGDFLIAVVIVCGAVAVAYIACKAMGVMPPPWLIQIFWIVLIVVVAIFAIRLILSM